MLQHLLALALFAAPPAVQVTRWVSPGNERPTTFREWCRTLGAHQPWNALRVRAPRPGSGSRADIIVQDSLFPYISDRLDTLIADLDREGLAAGIWTVRGSDAESLRALLRAEHDSGLVSAILVGDVPIAWFQLIDDWDVNGSRSSDEEYEEFPCDYYFMDLDGDWQDRMTRLDTLDSLVPGSDLIYDSNTGAVDLEIAVSRLPASRCGDAVTLIQQYLDRNHAYRTGDMPIDDRALVYVDDDWRWSATGWAEFVGRVYWQRVLVWSPESTRVADYRPRIDTAAYQWIHLVCHSWSGGHCMWYNNHTSMDWFFSDEIPGLDPEAAFYNLVACSNARFVERSYCAGAYVLNTSHGLAAIGSTKTGAMIDCRNFYGSLGAGRSLGEALQEWFAADVGDCWAPWRASWYMGMCITGDATLHPRVASAPPDQRVSLSLSPNPCLLERPVHVARSLRGPCAADIFDACGRRRCSFTLSASLFTPSALPAGLYFLRLTSSGRSFTAPLTIVK